MKKHRFGALAAAGILALSFAGTAFADGSVAWEGNGIEGDAYDVQCGENDPAGTMLWIFTTGGGDATSGTILINGSDQYVGYTSGNGLKFQTPVYLPADLTSAVVTFVGSLGNGQAVVTISHYCPEETTTTTDTETTTTTETTDTETTTTETTDTETTDTETTSKTTSTGTEAEVTPPSTDTIGESSTGAMSGSLFLVLAGLLALALAVPAKARSRR